MSELLGFKTCPFCGEDPYFSRNVFTENDVVYSVSYSVKCRECNITMASEHQYEVKKRWNRRAYEREDRQV